MKKAIPWLLFWVGSTVATVAWLSSKVEMTSDERLHLIVGTAAISAFVTAAVALTLRKA